MHPAGAAREPGLAAAGRPDGRSAGGPALPAARGGGRIVGRTQTGRRSTASCDGQG
jgi:hypothetical protein